MVGNALMDGADQVRRLRVVELETELALGIGLGAAGFFHPLTQLEQDDLVSGGGLASSGVLDGAGESLSRGEGGEEEDGYSACCSNEGQSRLWTELLATSHADGSGREILRVRGNFALRSFHSAQDDSSAVGRSQDRVPFCGARFSRRAISARMVAASSCKEDFSD